MIYFDLGQGIDSAMLLLRLANSISDRVYFPLEGFLGSHFGCDCGRMTIVRAALFWMGMKLEGKGDRVEGGRMVIIGE